MGEAGDTATSGKLSRKDFLKTSAIGVLGAGSHAVSELARGELLHEMKL